MSHILNHIENSLYVMLISNLKDLHLYIYVEVVKQNHIGNNNK